MPKFRFTKAVFCLSVLAVIGSAAYTLESQFKPQQSWAELSDTQPHVDILSVPPFADVKNQAEILGAASALMVMADGRIAKPELAFMKGIIANADALNEGQGEYDLNQEILVGLDRRQWMTSFEQCLEATKFVPHQRPPFTSADYLAFQQLLDKRIKRLEDPAGSYLILLALAKIWSSKDFVDGTPDQVLTAMIERDRAMFFFRKLRKSYKQGYQPQQTIQQPVALQHSEPVEGLKP